MSPLSARPERAPRILAVDDQPANLLLVRRVLTAAGFEVREARSGGEALAVARETMPDLILLDMHLPDMHGLDVLRRLRESDWGGGLRVVAMSALASAEDEAVWLRAGCAGSLEKPIRVATFAREVAGWLPGAGAPAPGEPGEPRKGERLGEILVAHQLLAPEQLAQALAVQAATGRRLGQILVQQGAVSEDDLAWALSTALGYPYVFLTPDIIDEDAARHLPEAFLRERRVLPILQFGQEMTLAMADPTDQPTVDEVAARTGLEVKRALALASNIEAMLDRLFAHRSGEERRTPAEVQYLQFHLRQALQQEASEIHFDPGVDGRARVRYRMEGTLVDRPAQPAELHAAILRHLRDLTGLDDQPAGRGAGSVAVGDRDVYLAAAFLPTADGPAATVALYPRRGDVPGATGLGLVGDEIAPLRRVLERRRGIVFVGCADPWIRSTVLHTLLPSLQGGKIWTLETLPVYRRPTLQQTFLSSGADVAAYLGTVAAAGADVILVDDLQRAPSVRAAFEAARSAALVAGHPQDDVVGLLAQVLEDGGAALVASTLHGILAARGVRLLCPECKAPVPGRGGPVFAPHGCEACGFTGFRGRRVLTETWVPDDAARMLLRTGRVAAALKSIARTVGPQMAAQARFLVEQGLTAPEEVGRVLEGAEWTSPTS